MLIKEVVEAAESAPVKGTDRQSIRARIRIIWLAGMICTALIVVLSVGLYQRKAAIGNAYEKTNLVRSGKSGLLNVGFKQWTELIRNFSANAVYTAAMSDFGKACANLENDNFSTTGASTLEEIKPLVEGYYTTSVMPVLEERSGKAVSYKSLLPSENKQWILQYLYLASQPDARSRFTLTRAADGSMYSTTHAVFHPEMIRYARENGLQDILLVDYASGMVVYSLRKNADFGTSLFDGPYRNTALGLSFRTALGMPSESVFVSDFEIYPAAGMEPVFFMAAPVYAGADLLGVVVFSYHASTIDRMLAIQADGSPMASGQSAFLLGSDLLYRSTDQAMLADPVKYLRKLKRNSTLAGEYENVSRLGTTILGQSVDRGKFGAVRAGKEGQVRYTTETGQDVLCSFGPVLAGNQQLILVSQMDLSHALQPVNRLIWFLSLLSLLLIVVSYLAVHYLTGKLSIRLVRLSQSLGIIGSQIASKVSEKEPADEIGMAVRTASEIDSRIRNAAGVLLKMAAGEIDNHFEATGDDILAKALLKLKDSLISQREADELRKKADDIRNWSAQGIAMFNEILRTDNDNMEKLCLNIIRNLIQYLSANQGGMFLIEEEDGKRFLNLAAAYAYDRQKFIQRRIGLGEGLAGTCALEKKTVLLSRIPDNYIEITSGLGGAKPACILIVPLKKEEEVLGVIEIASFEAFKPHEVEFAEKVAESIASALITVQLHLQTSLYLERFRQQAEEMKAQDEELRQNIEELQATHEQMERMKEQDEEQNRQKERELVLNQQLFIDILDKIPAKIFLKDEQGTFVVVNSAVSSVYNKTINQVIGTSDYDNHPGEDVDSWRKQELEIMEKGETVYLHAESMNGVTRHLKTLKMPFRIATTGTTGLLGIQFDVTREKELEETLKQLTGKDTK